jgi:proteasome-associated ATPase
MTNDLVRKKLISCIDQFVRNPSGVNRELLITLLNDAANQEVVQEIIVDLFVKQKDLLNNYDELDARFKQVQIKHDELQKIVQQERKYSYYHAIIIDHYLDEDSNLRVVTMVGGLKEDMTIAVQVKKSSIIIGNEAVVLNVNGTKTIVDVKEPSSFDGAICRISKIIDDRRVLASRFNGGEEMPGLLRNGLDISNVSVGSSVRIDLASRIVYEVFENKPDASRFALTGNATTTFNDVGGMVEAKKALYQKLILPLKNPNIFKQYDIKPIRGILLYGPPGVGKTFCASAVFNEIISSLNDNLPADKLKEIQQTHFFSVGGAEVLSKWVGESEQVIRDLFRAAKEVSLDGYPSIIFWDEIDSIARTRQETHAYAIEKTIVPTLLNEINGLNTAGNVILIAATNRPDLLDSAILRAGRLGDLKLEIKRPNKEESLDIIKKYLKQEYKTDNCSYDDCINAILDVFFNNRVLGKIQLSDNSEYIITTADLISGAVINKIVQDVLMETALKESVNESNGISKETLRLFSEKEIAEQIKLFKAHNIKDFISLPDNVHPISVNILA